MLHFFASNLTTSTKIISIFVFADCYITDYLKLYCIRNSFFLYFIEDKNKIVPIYIHYKR